MKRLIAAAIVAAITIPAQADVVASAPRVGGGEIVLTNLQGKCPPRSKIAFARNSGGKTVFGCWSMEGEYVVIGYEDGDFLTYDYRGFTMTEKHRSKNKGGTSL